jgi:hypothetical protein
MSSLADVDDETPIHRIHNTTKKEIGRKGRNIPKLRKSVSVNPLFGELHKYLKTTRMNRVMFDRPKSLGFRSKSVEKFEV